MVNRSRVMGDSGLHSEKNNPHAHIRFLSPWGGVEMFCEMCDSHTSCSHLGMWHTDTEDRLTKKLDYMVSGAFFHFLISKVCMECTFLSPRSKL